MDNQFKKAVWILNLCENGNYFMSDEERKQLRDAIVVLNNVQNVRERMEMVNPVMIKCPKCDTTQAAVEEHPLLWGGYAHHCENCKYIIMESEWNVVKPFKAGEGKAPESAPNDLKPGNKTPDWMEHFKPPFTHSYTSVLNADRNIVLMVRGCDHLSNKLSDLEVMSVAREEMTKTIADILNKLAGKQNLKMK